MALAVDLTHGHATDSGSENLGNQSTDSISPASGSLVLVGIGSNHPSGTPNIPTVSGLSMTWDQIDTVVIGSKQRTTLLRGVANGNSGALTISHGGQNQQNIYWGVVQITQVDTGGTNGSNAIVQSNRTSGTGSGSATVTLSSFTNLNNSTFGVIYYNAGVGISPGSGFTEIGEALSSHVFETEFKSSNDTSVDWSFAGVETHTAIAVELKTLDLTGPVSVNFN